jgi:hypothetical protein
MSAGPIKLHGSVKVLPDGGVPPKGESLTQLLEQYNQLYKSTPGAPPDEISNKAKERLRIEQATGGE